MKNIIILCDGTGNEISENISNVLKFYRCLRKTDKTNPRQMVFYDPGVGTLARPNPWRKLSQDFTAILGLATGYGLDDKVLAGDGFRGACHRARIRATRWLYPSASRHSPMRNCTSENDQAACAVA